MRNVILSGPQDLADQGFEILNEPSLLDTPVYREYRQRLDQMVELIPELAARKPWDYQARYAAMGACRNRNLWAHEQGLGKTYETILLILLRYYGPLLGRSHKRIRRGTIQILAPRHTLRLAWLNEFKLCSLDSLIEIITNERDLDRATAPIWLLSYDLLKTQTRHGRNLAKKGKMRAKRLKNGEVETYYLGHPLWKKLRQVARPHMIVIDEVHNLREGSERTQVVKQYARGVKNILAMTGTPIDGWVSHLATILGVVYGEQNKVFPWTPKLFTKKFTRERVYDLDFATGEKGNSLTKRAAPGINPDQIPEFWRATRHLMHRLIYRDPEVSPYVKFPPVAHHLVRCQMAVDQHTYYYDVHQAVMQDVERTVKSLAKQDTLNLVKLRDNVLSAMQLLRRTSTCPWSVDFPPFGPLTQTMTAKIIQAVAICQQHAAEGRKIIIFTNWVEVGKVLVNALQAAGLMTTRIYASDKKETPVNLKFEDREERIEDFLGDDKYQVLVGNLSLLSTGLTMVQASVVINFDHDWKANAYKQGISRVVRPGQVWPHVDIYDLVSDQTVDVYIFDALMRKIQATAELIDHQFALEDPNMGPSIDPLAIAKALIAGDLAIA